MNGGPPPPGSGGVGSGVSGGSVGGGGIGGTVGTAFTCNAVIPNITNISANIASFLIFYHIPLDGKNIKVALSHNLGVGHRTVL